MQPTASLAVLIYNFSGMPFENQIELAWAASLVLVLIVLVFNILSRLVGQRQSLSTTEGTHRCMPRSTRAAAARPADEPAAPAADGTVAIDCKLDKVYYGDFLAVRDSHVPIEKGKITGFIGPSGCGKSTVLRSLNRMNDLIRGFRFEGHVHFHGQDIYAQSVDPVVGAPPHRHGVPAAQPVLDEHLRQRRLRPAAQPLQGQHGRAGRAGAAPRRAVGRGQGQAQEERPVAVRRPAAAAVHRPRHRHRAHGAADGRAVLGARPDRDPARSRS